MLRAVLVPLFLLGVTLHALAADPFVGSWKLNAEKSRGRSSYTPSVNIESIASDSYRITLAATRTEAQPFTYTVVLDGKEHPYEENATQVASRVNDRRFIATIKGAKGSVTTEYEVSPDLKTLTVTRKGTGSSSGRNIEEVIAFNK